MFGKKKKQEEQPIQQPAQISFVDQFIIEGIKANWTKLPVINADKTFGDLIMLMNKTYIVPVEAESIKQVYVCLINDQLFNIVLNQQPNGTTAPANQ